jgi:transposase
VASDTLVKGFSLSAGNASDAVEGRLLLETVGPLAESAVLLMDRAYEDDKTRLTAWGLRFNPVVPPKRNRVHPWNYDRELYRRRNEVERFFRRIKGYRRVCTRYDKLDMMFTAFIYVALTVITLRSVNTP